MKVCFDILTVAIGNHYNTPARCCLLCFACICIFRFTSGLMRWALSFLCYRWGNCKKRPNSLPSINASEGAGIYSPGCLPAKFVCVLSTFGSRELAFKYLPTSQIRCVIGHWTSPYYLAIVFSKGERECSASSLKTKLVSSSKRNCNGSRYCRHF